MNSLEHDSGNEKEAEETLEFTTSSGCLFVYDEELEKLLVLGSHGSLDPA